MKTAIKFTALAVAMALIVISCAVEAELTPRDWKEKTADLDAARLDNNTNLNQYKPSASGSYDSADGIVIFFPDAADVLRNDNATIESKLKEFLTFYTYSKGLQNTPDMLSSSQDYEFVKRLPANGGENITLKLRSYPTQHLTIKIDAGKYTFAGGRKLGGADDPNPGTEYYDVYLSCQVSGLGQQYPGNFINPWQLGNILTIHFQVDTSATTPVTTKATVASLSLSPSVNLGPQETNNLNNQLLHSVASKIKLQKYGVRGWEDAGTGSPYYDSINQVVTVTFQPDNDETLYRVEATGMNDLTVNYWGRPQRVEVRGYSNQADGYNRSVVVSNVYHWQSSNKLYVASNVSLFYGSEWVTVDKEGKNAILRVWFKSLNVPNSGYNYYLSQMSLTDFNKYAKIVFKENGTLSSNTLASADDLCFFDVKAINYSSSFSPGMDTLTITLDPNFNVKEWKTTSVYFLLSPGFKYDNDNIVFGSYNHWNCEIDGVKYFDVYNLPFNTGNAPLSAPTSVNAYAASQNSINLNWNAVSGASSYKISRSLSSSGTYTQVGGNTNNTSYTDNQLVAGITYYYKVAAVDNNNQAGAESSIVQATTTQAPNPGQVVGATTVSVTATTTNSVSLSWTSVSDASSYHIFRSDSQSGTYNPISLSQYGTSYTDNNVSIGTTYWYKVIPVGSNGYQGNESVAVSATTQGGASGPLTAPQGLQVTGTTTSSISLSWSIVSGADSYVVYRGTDYSNINDMVINVNNPSFTDTGLLSGATYYYQVIAYRGSSTPPQSDRSSTVQGVTQQSGGGTLSAPTNLSATPTATTIFLSWDSVANAEFYYIYRSNNSSGPYMQITYSYDNYYTDTNVSPSTTYYYQVTAYRDTLNPPESGRSATVSAQTGSGGGGYPSAPTSLSATAQSSTSINITWNAGTYGYTYFISRSTSQYSDYTAVGATNGEWYLDEGLSSSTTYYYRVAAVNSSGNMGEYASASATTQSGGSSSLPAPTGLTATAQSSSAIYLNWNNVPGAAYYNIYRGSSSSNIYFVTETSALEYDSSGLQAATMYYFQVAAVDSNNNVGARSTTYATTLSSGGNPAFPPNYSTTLSSGVWANGDIPSNSQEDWYSFTATASTQYYIHVNFGTLTDLYVQLYNSNGNGNPVGDSYNLYGFYRYASQSVVSGQTYYIRVYPYGSTNYGSYQIAFNTSSTPPDSTIVPAPTGLTVTGTTSSSVSLSWNAVPGASYYYLTRSTSPSGSFSYLNNASTNSYTDGELSAGTTYYYRVVANVSGTFSPSSDTVAGTTLSGGGNPIEPSVTPLYSDEWVDDYLANSSASNWYTFDVNYGTTYYIWWNDSYRGDGTKTTDVYVDARYNSTTGNTIFSGEDSGWTSGRSFTANTTGTVYVRVYNNYSSGTYAIAYSTSNVRPGDNGIPAPPETPLTAGVWANGSLTSSVQEAWYSFEVYNGSTYYLWWNDADNSGGTLDIRYALYNGSSGSQIRDSDAQTSATYSATFTGTVYVKVYPYSGSGTGTYGVAYSTNNYRP